jgi:hypothetical protein
VPIVDPRWLLTRPCGRIVPSIRRQTMRLLLCHARCDCGKLSWHSGPTSYRALFADQLCTIALFLREPYKPECEPYKFVDAVGEVVIRRQ